MSPSLVASTAALLLLALSLDLVASATPVNGVANDILPKYGLPRGLLPDVVKSYSLSDDGEFEIELESPCYVQFSHLVYYEKVVKGKLSYGAISNLSGIQAKKLFLWVSISGIVAHPDAGTIEFQVGFISESLSEKEFEAIPVCKAKAAYRGAAGMLSEIGILPISEA
ncbi:uncharacterized protein [Typha latifolia]|uniref:uncharacterized protein n=1 Tax=Typha latifolia TaxID=4733 RepID=UPI003C2BAAF0